MTKTTPAVRLSCSYPACFHARWMAATGPDGASADEEARNPMTGIVIAGSCAPYFSMSLRTPGAFGAKHV